MKRFMKNMVVLWSVIFFITTLSCNGNKDISDPISEPSCKTDAELAKETLSIVSETLENFSLPAVCGRNADVTVEWKSNNNDVISIDVSATEISAIVTRPENDTTVVLTATLTDSSANVATKDFNVLVYAEDAEIGDENYLELAFAKFDSLFTAPAYAYNEIEISKNLIIGEKEVTFDTFTSTDENHVYLENDKIYIKRDLVDRTVDVSLKLSYGSASETKEFSIKLPAVSVFNYYDYYDYYDYFDGFDGNEYEVTEKYSMAIDSSAKIITWEGKWIKVPVIAGKGEEINEVMCAKFSYESIVDNKVINVTTKEMKTDVAFGDLEADTWYPVSVIKSQLSKGDVDKSIKEKFRFFENIDFDYYIDFNNSATTYVNKAFVYLESAYAEGKEWYEQFGCFEASNLEVDINGRIKVFHNNEDILCDISCSFFDMEANEDYSEFIYNQNNSYFKFIIVDNADGTISLTVYDSDDKESSPILSDKILEFSEMDIRDVLN